MRTSPATIGLVAIALLAGLAAASPALAGNLAAPGTGIIWLLADCEAAGRTLGDDCFQEVDAGVDNLQDKIWGEFGLHPTAETPLVVDIGAGDFKGTLKCPDGGGYVSFRGVGRERSRLIAGDAKVWYVLTDIYTALLVDNCQKLSFQDLALVADQESAIAYAVAWRDGGTSTWTDVDLDGASSAWYDACPLQDVIGEHYFFGSRLTAGGTHGLLAQCDRSWFYSSEVRAEQNFDDPGQIVEGVGVAHSGEVQMFGSAVIVSIGTAKGGSAHLYGVRVAGPGKFHIHGGIIAVDASEADGPRNVTGIRVEGVDSRAHTLETAWRLEASTHGGTVTRLKGTGDHESPFVWQAGTGVPVEGLKSKTGADMFVETDCDPSNVIPDPCTGGSRPHLMVYVDSSICASTWFDAVTGECRP